MKTYKIFLIVLVFTLIGCSGKELGVLIQRPVDKQLDGKELIIKLNGNQVYNEVLKVTDIIPLHTSTEIPIEKSGMNKLEVILDENKYELDFDYPKDKYLIISPTYLKDKVNVSFKTSSEKFKTI